MTDIECEASPWETIDDPASVWTVSISNIMNVRQTISAVALQFISFSSDHLYFIKF